MTGEALVLRPEPGNGRTADRLRHAGFPVRRLPLFATRPLDWLPPDPARYDALLLTSANAVLHAGPGLAGVRTLPAVAVGHATARAARAAGLNVVLVGAGGAAEARTGAIAAGLHRLLHLAGRERVDLPGVDAVVLYASDPLPIAPGLLATLHRPLALLHSPRAARRLADLAARDGVDRREWTLAALSPAVAAAAGEGWRRMLVAPAPSDAHLIAVLPAH